MLHNQSERGDNDDFDICTDIRTRPNHTSYARLYIFRSRENSEDGGSSCVFTQAPASLAVRINTFKSLLHI